MALRGMAHSAIDLSDGLLADLGHILERSKVAAELRFDKLPLSSHVTPYLAQALGKQCALAGAIDYELCFTAPVRAMQRLKSLSAQLDLPLNCIGQDSRRYRLQGACSRWQ